MSDPRAGEVVSGYASIARGYREQLGDELVGKPLDRAFLDAFVERVKGLIVDVGCGPGSLTLLLAPNFVRAIGVDADQGMIDEAAIRRVARALHRLRPVQHQIDAFGGRRP